MNLLRDKNTGLYNHFEMKIEKISREWLLDIIELCWYLKEVVKKDEWFMDANYLDKATTAIQAKFD